MKRILALSLLILTAVVSFTSCKETEAFDDKANWENRNNDFMADIASQYASSHASVEEAQKGQMFRLLTYKLDPEKEWNSLTSYVYGKVVERGEGTVSPTFTDSVRINYRVRLIPSEDYPQGQVIDQSYKTSQMNPAVNTPASFITSNLVEGVATALMHMHVGDSWLLYIPFDLGYGTKSNNDIPAYSTLIFEMNLVEFSKAGAPLSPR